jgi:hypothetical protein
LKSLASAYLLIHGIVIGGFVVSFAAGTALFRIAVGTSVVDSFAVAFQRPPAAMTALVGSGGAMIGRGIWLALLILVLFAAATMAVWDGRATARRYAAACALAIVALWVFILLGGAAAGPIGGATIVTGLVDCLFAAGVVWILYSDFPASGRDAAA